MISPLDETCPPPTILTPDNFKLIVDGVENGSDITIADDGKPIRTSEVDEPCPGARIGNGCE